MRNADEGSAFAGLPPKRCGEPGIGFRDLVKSWCRPSSTPSCVPVRRTAAPNCCPPSRSILCMPGPAFARPPRYRVHRPPEPVATRKGFRVHCSCEETRSRFPPQANPESVLRFQLQSRFCACLLRQPPTVPPTARTSSAISTTLTGQIRPRLKPKAGTAPSKLYVKHDRTKM
jgi:hypothetical protein